MGAGTSLCAVFPHAGGGGAGALARRGEAAREPSVCVILDNYAPALYFR